MKVDKSQFCLHVAHDHLKHVVKGTAGQKCHVLVKKPWLIVLPTTLSISTSEIPL